MTQRDRLSPVLSPKEIEAMKVLIEPPTRDDVLVAWNILFRDPSLTIDDVLMCTVYIKGLRMGRKLANHRDRR